MEMSLHYITDWLYSCTSCVFTPVIERILLCTNEISTLETCPKVSLKYNACAAVPEQTLFTCHTVRDTQKLICVAMYEVSKDNIFMGASKTTKSTKILVLKSFRLYGI